MIEFLATDVARTSEWYRLALGLRVVLDDPARGFLLLEGAGLRLALKRAEAGTPADARLSFLVEDLGAERRRLSAMGLECGPTRTNAEERYAEFRLIDPDGREVRLFAWDG